MQVDKWPISKTTIVGSPKVYDLPSHGLLQATAGGMNSLLWSSPQVFGVWDRVHYIGVALCLSLPYARMIGVRHHTQLGGITSMVIKPRWVSMIDNNYLCISKHAMILQFNRQKLNTPSTKKCYVFLSGRHTSYLDQIIHCLYVWKRHTVYVKLPSICKVIMTLMSKTWCIKIRQTHSSF